MEADADVGANRAGLELSTFVLPGTWKCHTWKFRRWELQTWRTDEKSNTKEKSTCGYQSLVDLRETSQFVFLTFFPSLSQRNIAMGIFRLIKHFWLKTFPISCQTLWLREIKYCPIYNYTSPNWWLLCVTTVLHMNRWAPDYRLLWMQESTGWNLFTILILTVIPNTFNPVLCSFALLYFSVVFVHTGRKKRAKIGKWFELWATDPVKNSDLTGVVWPASINPALRLRYYLFTLHVNNLDTQLGPTLNTLKDQR